MRIVRLTASNVKRLKAVDITPDGDVVVISGGNAQGKTSVLDAIWLALGGGAAGRGTPVPIREGEDHASVTLDLGDLKVTRTWTGDKTTLKVENADGARFGSPQSMLDSLVGRLSFDPLTFAQQDEKTQRATLLSLVDLPFDPDALDSLRRGAFDQRTDVNRAVKTYRAQLDAMPEPPEGLPNEEQSLSDLLDRAAKAREYQQRAALVRADFEAAAERYRRKQEELLLVEADYLSCKRAVDDIPADLPNPASYDAQIRDLEQTNREIRAAQQRESLAALLAEVQEQSDHLTARISEIDQQKEEGLAAATMPLPGLAFDETGVLYQGVPLKQASAAEQLRVSIAMAMALNPKVRVIRITDGSLLDSKNLALIEEMARERDFQVWIEKVDESGTVGIVIEDGQVLHREVAGARGGDEEQESVCSCGAVFTAPTPELLREVTDVHYGVAPVLSVVQ